MTTIIVISPHPNGTFDVEVLGNDQEIDNTALQQTVLSQLQESSGANTPTTN